MPTIVVVIMMATMMMMMLLLRDAAAAVKPASAAVAVAVAAPPPWSSEAAPLIVLGHLGGEPRREGRKAFFGLCRRYVTRVAEALNGALSSPIESGTCEIYHVAFSDMKGGVGVPCRPASHFHHSRLTSRPPPIEWSSYADSQ
jgi:hypothetical protein